MSATLPPPKPIAAKNPPPSFFGAGSAGAGGASAAAAASLGALANVAPETDAQHYEPPPVSDAVPKTALARSLARSLTF